MSRLPRTSLEVSAVEPTLQPALSAPRLLLWSAPDDERERRRRHALRRYVSLDGDGDGTPERLARAAALAAERRGTGTVRGAVVAATVEDAVRALADPPAARAPGGPRPVVLLFPGQGAQQPAMAAGLYGWEPHFTAALDRVFTELGPEGARLRDRWLAGDADPAMDDAPQSQPLLFGIGYALGRMVLDWGITPAALLGHSVGELVAATLSGVFTLPDALWVLRDRVAGAAGTGPGGMLAVAASAEDLVPYLPVGGRVTVAAVNAPRQTLLAGPEPELRAVEARLRADGRTCRRAASHQAFHSPVMDGVARLGRPLVAAARPGPPSWPLYSAYLPGLLDAGRAVDPEFWARQIADPVLFWPALDALLATGGHLLVEAGPGQGLSAIARLHRTVRTGDSAVAPLLPARSGTAAADRRALLGAAGRIWTEGHALGSLGTLAGHSGPGPAPGSAAGAPAPARVG
ncbi:acyltransferase domain-containing protein [Streptomyces sp. NPDC001889]